MEPQRKTKNSFERNHSRSKSALSKPKVIKNIFEPQTPKVKRETVASAKSLLYTFGL